MRSGLVLFFAGIALLIGVVSSVRPLWADVPPPHAQAEHIVAGPKDGLQVESLAPIATPTLAAVEKLTDTGFPTLLEKQGEWASALLEWQRIAYQEGGVERHKALLHIANLQYQLGEDKQLAQTAAQLLQDDPSSTVLAQLAYEDIWKTAQKQGHVTSIPSALQADPRVPRLQQHLAVLEALQKPTGTMVAGLSVVPGLGHMVLGQATQGAVILIMWALFGLAFLSACRHRHFAYAFLWVLPFAALWVNAPVLAYQQALAQANAERLTAMAQWADLTPPPFHAVDAPPAPPLAKPIAVPPRPAPSPTVLSTTLFLAVPSPSVPHLTSPSTPKISPEIRHK